MLGVMNPQYPADSLAAQLADDHAAIDVPFHAVARGETSPEALDNLSSAVHDLRSHIYMEEEHLFPPLREAGMMMPVMVMIREHAQMWPLLDRIDQAIAAPSHDELPTLCQQVAGLLKDHNEKEEQILYSQADATVPAGAAAIIESILDTHVLPQGWVCQGLH